MGSKSLRAAPLWAARYQIGPAVLMLCATISGIRKFCILKVLMSISPPAEPLS
jgi:hypothetical protein